jgi:enolase-phosphatase E1
MKQPHWDAYVFDIEGTTTSISFVYDVLFPFVRREVANFVEAHWTDPAMIDLARDFRELADADVREGRSRRSVLPAGAPPAAVRESLVAVVIEQMDADRKSTPLKALQGRIWRSGYDAGELRGHVFADVPPALAALKEHGRGVYIYSSGSVEAQRLLFAHSEAGDLTPLLDGYYDTTTGPKKEPASYAAIADSIGLPVDRIVFVSDNLDELRAARAAGMPVLHAVRPGNPPPLDPAYATIRDFGVLIGNG